MENYIRLFQMNQGEACELCGSNDMPVKDQSPIDGSICLCSKCSNYIKTLPIYGKDSIERFLLGNVI